MILTGINPYYINIGLIVLYASIFLSNKKLKNGKKLFVIFSTLNWIILSGLRHMTIGADTLSYHSLYMRTMETNWGTLFSNFINILFFGQDGKDPGYDIFVKFTQVLTQDYQVFLIIVAFLFTVPLGVWIYKNSKNTFISMIIYSVLFYAFFSITGTRQTLVTSLVVFIGYKYIKERKMIPFLILIFIGFTIHKSAIVFLPFYFLSNIKVTKKIMISILAVFPILMYFRVSIMFFLQKFGGYDYEIYEGAGTIYFTLLLILVFIVSIYKFDRITSKDPKAIHYYNAIILALVTTPMTWVNPSAMRVVQYYSIFLMLLIPNIMNSLNRNEKPLAYFLVLGLLLMMLFKNNPQYMFYWQ